MEKILLTNEHFTVTKNGVSNHLDEEITEILYADLVTLRDNSQLIPGKQYRITDYVTTSIENETRSALHPFDIIVTAVSKNKLSPNAECIKNANDESNYWKYSNGTEFYFDRYKLVYTLDNIKWSAPSDGAVGKEGTWYKRNSASDVVGADYPYAWGGGGTQVYYSATETPSSGDTLYSVSDGTGDSLLIDEFVVGKGTITRMTDNYLSNDVTYDYHNILYKRYWVTGGVIDNRWFGIKGVTYPDGSIIDDSKWIWAYTFSGSMNQAMESGGTTADSAKQLTVFSNIIRWHGSSISKLLPNITLSQLRGNNYYSKIVQSYDICIQELENSTILESSAIFIHPVTRHGMINSTISYSNGVVNSVILKRSVISYSGGITYRSLSNSLVDHVSSIKLTSSQFNIRLINLTNSEIGQLNTVDIKDSSYITITKPLYNSEIKNANYVTLTTNQTTSTSTYLNKITIKGIDGTSESPKVISHNTVNDEFETVYQPINSKIVNI